MNSSISNFFTLWAIRFGRLARLLPLLALALFLGSNPELRAQDAVPFFYVTNQNAITITGYSGPGGAVTIPATLNGLPVTSIGDRAFYNRAVLTQISLPNSLTTLGEQAFYRCTGLTQVTLPENLANIGSNAFSDCSGLTAIEVSNANPNYSGVDGVLFDKHRTTILQYPEGRAGTYTLPDGVTAVGSSAFLRCTGLTQITLPNSLTTLGEYAFLGCTGLTQISLPNSLTTIGGWVFSGCTGLTQISLPNSLTTVGEYAFTFCTGLTQITLPNSLTTLGESAFYGCTGLAQITLPDSLTTLGSYAFSGCTDLTQITLPNSLTTVGEYAFTFCTGLTYARFAGNAPVIPGGGSPFGHLPFHFPGNVFPTVLYLPGTSGWSDTFGGVSTAPWLPALGRPTTTGGLPDGSFGFTVDWAPHRQVTVEACDDLAQPDWQPEGTVTLDATGTAQFSDPAAASHPSRLYRLRTP